MDAQQFAFSEMKKALLVPNAVDTILDGAEQAIIAYVATQSPTKNFRPSLELFVLPNEETTLSTETLLERAINAITLASELMWNSDELFENLMDPLVKIVITAYQPEVATLRQIAIKCVFQISDKIDAKDKDPYFKRIIGAITDDSADKLMWPDCRVAINIFSHSCQVLGSHFIKYFYPALEYTMKTAFLVENDFSRLVSTAEPKSGEVCAALKSLQIYTTHLPTMLFSGFAREIIRLISEPQLLQLSEDVKYSSVECLATICKRLPAQHLIASAIMLTIGREWESNAGKLYSFALRLNIPENADFNEVTAGRRFLKLTCENSCQHFKLFLQEMDAKRSIGEGPTEVLSPELPEYYLLVLNEFKGALCCLFDRHGSNMLPHMVLLFPEIEKLLYPERLPSEMLFSLEVYTSMILHCGKSCRHLLATSAAITRNDCLSTVGEVKSAAAYLLCRYVWNDNFTQH